MTHRWKFYVIAALFSASIFSTFSPAGQSQALAQATPEQAVSCDNLGTPKPSTYGMDHGSMAATPVAVEFDQLYIDMMIPHHESVVSLAEAALPLLTDARLITLAENIVGAQVQEIAELQAYRLEFYGAGDPLPMDEQSMMQLMPGMSTSMDETMALMNADTLVATFCNASDFDLVFIDLVLPHHQSAVDASVAALDQATHDEIRRFAQRVIEDQQREIDLLLTVRVEIYGSATPTARVA